MAKFYKHDIAKSRAQSQERLTKARGQTAIPVLAEYQILHLLDINKHGLPDCYSSFGDFLPDFWADFSWTDKSRAEIQAVLDDARFQEVVPTLDVTWDISIVQILTNGLS